MEASWATGSDATGQQVTQSLEEKYAAEGFKFVYSIFSSLPSNPMDCAGVQTYINDPDHNAATPGSWYGRGTFLVDPLESTLDELMVCVTDTGKPTRGVPQTLFIDRGMRIRYCEIGFPDVDDPDRPAFEQRFEGYIQELLSE
ncbi:hypothetical protein ACFLU6_11780 [Acidobacteriota bacterium]